MHRMDVITIMIDNEFGVLTRITALIRRQGWSIRSLAVAETDDTELSRLTVSLDRRHSTLEQVIGRLSRLSAVREVSVFSSEKQVAQELCLVRLSSEDLPRLEELRRQYDAQTLEQRGDSVVLSVRCTPEQADELLWQCRKLGLHDLARTGPIALDR